MHELGIVFYIIDDVEEVVEKNELTTVSSVTLELGEVSGVVPSYLDDVWNWAVKKHECMTEAKNPASQNVRYSDRQAREDRTFR